MKRQAFQFKLQDIAGGDDEGTFTGLGSVFGNIDQGADIVAKGAFKASLRERAPQMLLQHGFGELGDMPVGKWDDVRETDAGLEVKGRLFLETDGLRLAYRGMKEGVFTGLSIGYVPVKSAVDHETGIRTLKQVDLYEISLVTFPMNQAATVSAVKSRLTSGQITKREFEEVLRDAGFSRKQAEVIVAKAYADLCQGDPDDDGNTETAVLAAMLQSIRGNPND